MSREILRAYRWGSNARMIVDVADLGYIRDEVLDATYGLGGFWRKWTPKTLVANDLNSPLATHHFDFRHLPFNNHRFPTVVYDPPYKLNGTPTGDAMDQRFGTGRHLTIKERLEMITEGAEECWRVTRDTLLVKCMDQVVSGQMVWQTVILTNLLNARGARLVDRFDFLMTPRKQPSGRVQKHARANYSTLLVFQ